MTRHLSTKLITLAVLAPCLAAPAVAQSMSPWYGGLSVGQTRSHLDEQSMADTALGGASTATGLVADRRHTGYRVFGGRQLGAGLALEAAYFDLGNFSFSSGTTAGDTLQGKTKMQGASLDLVGTLPLGDRLSLLGRIGGTYAKVRNTYTGTAPVANPSPNQREGNVKVGAGLQYAFGQNFMMRTEYERYRMNTGMGSRGNLDMISISAVFPFGGSTSRMSSLEERRARMAASEGRMQGADNMQAGMGSGMGSGMGAGMKDGMSPDQMIANEAPGAGPAPAATTATTIAADAPQRGRAGDASR
jgi:opacity protein-like surface antigen